jgi:hypothetical protein
MVDDHEILYAWILHSVNFSSFLSNDNSASRHDLIKRFRSEHNISNFEVINPGSVLMMLYGIFIIPKEFWRNQLGETGTQKAEADTLIFSDFEFNSKETFTFNIGNKDNISNEVFLRRFRNALAHSHVEVNKEEKTLRFKNYQGPDSQCNFDVSNDLGGLGAFADEIVRVFMSHLQ